MGKSWARRFVRQVFALTVQKNWLVVANHWVLNLFRCIILPVGFAVFLTYAQDFLTNSSNYGFGTPVPIRSLPDAFQSGYLLWADTTDGTGTPSAARVMSIVTRNLSGAQLSRVVHISDATKLNAYCPSNWNGKSSCFGAVVFNGFPTASNTTAPVSYTIHGDGNNGYINVQKHAGDNEKKTLPLQWAVDNAVVEAITGTSLRTPLEQPFTQRTNDEQAKDKRLSFISFIDGLFVLAFWLFFAGVPYQLAGAISSERATALTTHLHAMGSLRSARALSWLISITVPYMPAWIIAAVLWKDKIFLNTGLGTLIGINFATGISLASWSLLIAIPFGKSPQLSAIVTTGLAFVIAIVATAVIHSDFVGFIFTLFFPPAYFIFSFRAVTDHEQSILYGPDWDGSPSGTFTIGAPTIMAIICILLYPFLATWLEHAIYDAKISPSGWLCCGRRARSPETPTPDTAIEIRNVGMRFNKGKKKEVTAIEDLSLTVRKNGIYVVLGSNGSGKSTLHSIIAGIIGATSGSITFSGLSKRPEGGRIGIVPQKNVLFPELTCYQTVRLWSAIKGGDESREELEQLLVDCDLAGAKKLHALSGDLSGGQKRKLQLAIGLVGGSDILLVDEATSGVDPLSRRAIWRALTSVRSSRTIIFTTHFLDEADLLGDDIAILAAPGKLLAHGSPVNLKSTLGHGYNIHITFDDDLGHGSTRERAENTLALTRTLVSSATLQDPASDAAIGEASIQLGTNDHATIAAVLALIEQDKASLGISRYDTHGTTLEGIFLDLMASERSTEDPSDDEKPAETPGLSVTKLSLAPSPVGANTPQLSDARRISPVAQAWVIFLKRLIILKRSWLGPVLALAALLCAGCIPLRFMRKRHETCAVVSDDDGGDFRVSFFLPFSFIGVQYVYPGMDEIPYTPALPIIDPPNLLQNFNVSQIASELAYKLSYSQDEQVTFNSDSVPSGTTFEQYIQANYQNLSYGGISYDSNSQLALISYEAENFPSPGNIFLNTVSNVLLNQLQSTSGARIYTDFTEFPAVLSTGLGDALKWIGFLGLGLAAFPAFSTLYVTRERVSSVKAMQLSNGLTPAGHHLGHLFAELPIVLIGSTVMIIVWSVKAGTQFVDLGLMWFIFVLWGISCALYSFIAAMIFSSGLIAFAAVGLANLLLFVFYVAAYLLTYTYTEPNSTQSVTHIIHFTLGLLGPLPSILRAVFVSVNIFSIRCDGQGGFNTLSAGNILLFGGPLLYLILHIVFPLSFLIWADSGYPTPQALQRNTALVQRDTRPLNPDVEEEARRVANSTDDPLSVLNLSKRFKGAPVKAVDDVTFGVKQETFGLLGPNGAGKTTTFNIIRGGIAPDQGDAFVNGVSVAQDVNGARVGLGVCPQFTAIDSQLTVKEHLDIYGRLKGLSGEDLARNVRTLLTITTLSEYTNRLASKLSGGNQRKLSLAISLIGNPSVLLIDEYSTGIDPATKRHMWTTLRSLSVGKAVVITTHSMEEASALSDRVAILAGKLLAIGTVDDLVSRHPCYEVHVSCRSLEEQMRTQELLAASFPDCRRADDVATRWEVPISNGRTLSSLFSALSKQNLPEYAIERLSLESVFLKTIRNNDAVVEESTQKTRRFFGLF